MASLTSKPPSKPVQAPENKMTSGKQTNVSFSVLILEEIQLYVKGGFSF